MGAGACVSPIVIPSHPRLRWEDFSPSPLTGTLCHDGSTLEDRHFAAWLWKPPSNSAYYYYCLRVATRCLAAQFFMTALLFVPDSPAFGASGPI